MRIHRLLLSSLFAVAALDARAASIEIEVHGLVCGFCAQGIEKTLRGFEATRDVFVSLEQRVVAIELANGRDIADAELTRAITESGYATVRITRSEASLESIRARVRGEARADD